MSESRKSGKIRNRSQLKSSVQMLQQWNAEYRERIRELEAEVAKLTALLESIR